MTASTGSTTSSGSDASTLPATLAVRPADAAELAQLLAAVRGEGSWEPARDGGGAAWFLHAEQDDGYTVGHTTPAGQWVLADQVFTDAQPPDCRALDVDALIQLRVFRPGAELLAWTEPGGLVGVWRTETGVAPPEPLRPRTRRYLLSMSGAGVGRTDGAVVVRDGFTRITQSNGMRCVHPAAWPTDGTLRLAVRQHYQRLASGAVRVAVTCLHDYVVTESR